MSSRKSARRTKFAGSHQKSWLWGKYAILEVLKGQRWPVRELYVTEEASSQLDAFSEQLTEQSVSVLLTPASRITELCGHRDHQGFAARMAPYPLVSQEYLNRAADLAVTSAEQENTPPLFVACDRIQDAHNLGAILRTCDAMAVNGVILGTSSQATITPHVARASSGAVNFLDIYQVDDLAETLGSMKKLRYRLVAASEKATVPITQAKLKEPVVVVIGSESHGVASDLRELVDTEVAIPMHGQIESLNAAVACGILLHEARRQQGLYTPDLNSEVSSD